MGMNILHSVFVVTTTYYNILHGLFWTFFVVCVPILVWSRSLVDDVDGQKSKSFFPRAPSHFKELPFFALRS